MKKKEARVAAKKKKLVKKAAPKARQKSTPKTAAKAKAKKAAPKAAQKPASKKTAKPAKKNAKKVSKVTSKASPRKAAKKPSSKTMKKSAAPISKPLSFQAEKKNLPKDLQNFLTPLDDRLLVRLSGAEKMTAGGLYIPDTVSDVSGNLRGQVVSVGRGHRDDKGRIRPMDVVLGDHVIFAEHSGSKMIIQNEDLIILREAEVMGIVSK